MLRNEIIIMLAVLLMVTSVIFIGYRRQQSKKAWENFGLSVIAKSKEKKHVHLKRGVKEVSLPITCEVCWDNIFAIGEPKKETKKSPWKILGTFNVSAYCPCRKCCGKFSDGKTATMKNAYSRGVAVDTRIIPFGTKLYIPDYGIAIADDRGGKIKKNRLDVRFKTHREARYFGRKYLKVYYLEEK